MKTCIMLENCVVFESGKVLSWFEFYEVVRQLADYKIIEKMDENKKRVLKMEDIVRGQTGDLKDEMRILGVKPLENEKTEATRRRILKRIKFLNEKSMEGVHV